MSEHLKYEGKLLEKEKEARKLRLKVEGLVRSLRDALELPEITPAEELKGELIAGQALELADTQVVLRQVLEEIKSIKKILGR